MRAVNAFAMQINYQRPSTLSRFLASNTLPPLMLPVTVTPCPAGTEPNQAGNDCLDCASGTYSIDGFKCEECPAGASSRA